MSLARACPCLGPEARLVRIRTGGSLDRRRPVESWVAMPIDYYAVRSNARRSTSPGRVDRLQRVDRLDDGRIDAVVGGHVGGPVGKADDHHTPGARRGECRLERTGPSGAVDLDDPPPEAACHRGRVD